MMSAHAVEFAGAAREIVEKELLRTKPSKARLAYSGRLVALSGIRDSTTKAKAPCDAVPHVRGKFPLK